MTILSNCDLRRIDGARRHAACEFCATSARPHHERVQRQISSGQSRGHSRRAKLARFPQSRVRRSCECPCANRRPGDGAETRRKCRLSHGYLAEILKRVGGKGTHAHVPRSIQREQGQQWQPRSAMDPGMSFIRNSSRASSQPRRTQAFAEHEPGKASSHDCNGQWVACDLLLEVFKK